MKQPAHRQHDISDRIWGLLAPLLPGSGGSVGRPASDNRLFVNAVFWIMRTGAPWRDLPPDLGDWKNTHRRFSRWIDRSVWEKLLNVLRGEPDYKWLMIDASHCKVHPQAAGAKGGNQEMSRTKGGLNTKIHLAADAHGLPVRIAVTEGTRADCKEALDLIDGLCADALLADKAYDTNAIIKAATEQGMEIVILSKKNSIHQRHYNKESYNIRHLIENTFLHLKRWRGIATRYAKNAASFLAAVQIRCIDIWAKSI